MTTFHPKFSNPLRERHPTSPHHPRIQKLDVFFELFPPKSLNETPLSNQLFPPYSCVGLFQDQHSATPPPQVSFTPFQAAVVNAVDNLSEPSNLYPPPSHSHFPWMLSLTQPFEFPFHSPSSLHIFFIRPFLRYDKILLSLFPSLSHKCPLPLQGASPTYVRLRDSLWLVGYSLASDCKCSLHIPPVSCSNRPTFSSMSSLSPWLKSSPNNTITISPLRILIFSLFATYLHLFFCLVHAHTL